MKATTIFPIIIIVLLGCTQKEFITPNQVIADFNVKVERIPLEGWELQDFNSVFDSYYYYTNSDSDTLYELSFTILDKNMELQNKNQEYILNYYHKRYIEKEYIIERVIEDGFSIRYKENLETEQKTFEEGIYYYMLNNTDEFFKLGFHKKQFNYMLDNIDSLGLVKGNDILFPVYLNR